LRKTVVEKVILSWVNSLELYPSEGFGEDWLKASLKGVFEKLFENIAEQLS
jgi:hypothetical protein